MVFVMQQVNLVILLIQQSKDKKQTILVKMRSKIIILILSLYNQF